ncbi:MAG: CRISPR-associated helicase Cas3' [Bryobacteraceae bacterium]
MHNNHETETRFIAHRREADGAEQSVADHLIGVSRLARSHASKIGLGRPGELVGLLHDLGKYSLAFQNYLKSAQGLVDPDGDQYVDADALKGKIDHSTAGAQHIWRQLAGKEKFGSFAGQMLSLCIASHHSGLIDCISANREHFGRDNFTRRINKSSEKTYLDEVIRAADPSVLSRAGELLHDTRLFEELKLLPARIIEANDANALIIQQQFGLTARFLFSCLIDADRIDTADFENKRAGLLRQSNKYTDWQILADRLAIYLRTREPGRPIDELRREISQHCFEAAKTNNGILTLTVPTGGGKTLASLRFALEHARLRRLDRIVYVIPFTSIIDQNAETVRDILEVKPEEAGRIVLEHHSNLTPEQQSWREKILTENWDAPIVFTTMVQFLESLFGAGTRGARRMHQLANSVLIFDEVQTLPIKCVHLFNNAVNFLVEQCGASVVLCTATQPLLHEVSAGKGAIRLAAQHEIVPNRQALFDQLRRVEIIDGRRPGGWTNEEVSRLAMDETRRKGSCLVVVNTKRSAQHVYNLASEMDASERVHLSTNMCPAHRKDRLAYVRDRLENGMAILCVSTQLIEAGVDVDFGAAIRFLAGLDSIAQTAGRCNRNGRSKSGTVHIVNPCEESLKMLPEIKLAGDIAQRVLDNFRDDPERYRNDLCGPQAMDEYYRYYFFERQREMSYPVSAKELGHDDTLLNLLSGNTQAREQYQREKGLNVTIHFLQAFATAANAFQTIDAPTQGVVVPYGSGGRQVIADLCAAYEVQKQYKLLRLAQQYTVNVFPQVLKALAESGAVHPIQKDVGILCLDARNYSEEYGLVTEQVSGMELMYA